MTPDERAARAAARRQAVLEQMRAEAAEAAKTAPPLSPRQQDLIRRAFAAFPVRRQAS